MPAFQVIMSEIIKTENGQQILYIKSRLRHNVKFCTNIRGQNIIKMTKL